MLSDDAVKLVVEHLNKGFAQVLKLLMHMLGVAVEPLFKDPLNKRYNLFSLL